MNERLVILAPEQKEINGPVIFLAGPIQGAKDWQSEAIKIIHSINPKVIIASPRRVFSPDEENAFNEQVDWETKYLEKAGEDGVILFWLAKEAQFIPGRAYAQTTRWELATWKERHRSPRLKPWCSLQLPLRGKISSIHPRLKAWCSGRCNKTQEVKLVVGIEEGFSGARYIRKKLMEECPNILMLGSLEETCKRALDLL